jgi:hypothetical protein
VSVLTLRASNAGSVIDSTSDGDSKAVRSWPLRGYLPDTLATSQGESCKATLRKSISNGGQPRRGSEASLTDEPLRVAPVGPRVKHCVINAPWLGELRTGVGFTIR